MKNLVILICSETVQENPDQTVSLFAGMDLNAAELRLLSASHCFLSADRDVFAMGSLDGITIWIV